MRILLLKDVPKVGRKYEIKEVADGFARNKLFPNKLAELATSDMEARIISMKKDEATRGTLALDLLAKNFAALDGQVITMQEKANKKGHLFAAIREAEIAIAIRKQLGIDIPQEFIVLVKPLKETGEHSLIVQNVNKKARFILHLT